MFKLDREMPRFLKHNEAIIKRVWYNYNQKRVGTYYAPAYLRTTENINGYYDRMNFEGKSVLTVIGASDHVFNAILRGAKKVDAFDISMYAIMFYYLKEAAVKALNYEEFVEFLYDQNTHFSRDMYLKVLPYLNEKAVMFWNLVFNAKDSRKIITSNNFCFCTCMGLPVDLSKRVSSFLDKDNFYILKEKMKTTEVRVFLENALTLDNIDGKYDYIILSNIIDYVAEEKFKSAIERYVNKLNKGGEIKVGYIYHRVPSGKIAGLDCQVEKVPAFSETILGGNNNLSNYVLTKKGMR